MSPASETLLAVPSEAEEAAPAALRPTRPLYWSVRRELWENRSVVRAPLGVAAFAVAALVTHAATMPSHMPGMLANDIAKPGSAAVTYHFVAFLMLVTAFVTGAFYCLDALAGERRDRSILFWKSLPVSDRTTVVAKAGIPLVVLPLVTFAAVVAVHAALLLLSLAALLVQGVSAAPLLAEVRPLRMWPGALYAVAAATLWHAPLYAFLLLVSGWARRTAALWAVLPLLALGVLEWLTMSTLHVAGWAERRLLGWYREAFAVPAGEGMPFSAILSPTPGRFLAVPDLWIGLACAALFLAAAVRLRRHREPG